MKAVTAKVMSDWLARLALCLCLATDLAAPFTLPQPLDNFYEELVRFYKRVRNEGGEY